MECSAKIYEETAPSGDTVLTSVLPPEVYGQYYTLQDVVRLDARLQPIPRPADADDDIWLGGNPYDRNHTPRLILFTPGFSSIDYVPHDVDEAHNPAFPDPPFYSAYIAQDARFMIADTTRIHPADSTIATRRGTWHEAQRGDERGSTFRLLHADTGRLVIRVDYHRGNQPADYAHPHYEEMHYGHVAPSEAFGGRRALFFPSHDEADNYLIPRDSIPFHELHKLRHPPFILRPDTLRVGPEGGTFTVESSIALPMTFSYALSAYDGSERPDSIHIRELVLGRGSWVVLQKLPSLSFPVVVRPNEDIRPRRALIPMAQHYGNIDREPDATLVILQEGAPASDR